MATFIMLPNATVGTSDFTGNGGSSAVYSDVDNDNGATQYAQAASANDTMTFELASPSVAEEDIESIDSVQVKASVDKFGLGNGQMKLSMLGTDADGATISNGTNTIAVPFSGGYANYSGAAETTPNSGDWVYGDLAGLQIKAINTYNYRGISRLRISYFYAEVTYTEAAADVTDNATFFGANF